MVVDRFLFVVAIWMQLHRGAIGRSASFSPESLHSATKLENNFVNGRPTHNKISPKALSSN
jgi:hypothetical protein